MANRSGKGHFPKGKSGNPGGMSAEARAERERANQVLLCPERDEKWLKAYDKALRDGVAPVVLDYTHRKLGKPPERVHHTDETGERLFRGLPPERITELIDKTTQLLKEADDEVGKHGSAP